MSERNKSVVIFTSKGKIYILNENVQTTVKVNICTMSEAKKVSV